MKPHITGHRLLCRVARRVAVGLGEAALLGAVLVGCGGESQQPGGAEPGAASMESTRAGGPAGTVLLTVDAVTASDLRIEREGALSVHAVAGEVQGVRLGRTGAPTGAAQRIATVEGRVRTLVAGASAGRVAVAWLRTFEGHAHVERALGAGRAPTFGPPVEMERWPASDRDAALLIGAQDLALRVTPTGDFRLLHRATPVSCESNAECATYRHSGLDEDMGERRSSASLAAPAVCPWALPGIVEASGRTYYGLCALVDGAPLSTLYLLQPEPQYAQAERALAECRPLGVLAAPDATGTEAALFAADCPEGRVAVSLGAPGVGVRPVGPVQAPSCSAAGPALHVGALTVPLLAPRDRLEGFLPGAVAPAGARVLWTGDVFLVGEVTGSQLTVRAWSCEAAAALR